jgi:hypothetical protein
MFEIGIFCVIALAIGYGTALWLMSRRHDVLHGDFVKVDPGADPLPTQLPASRLVYSDSLQSLLVTIKQDLKDAAKI